MERHDHSTFVQRHAQLLVTVPMHASAKLAVSRTLTPSDAFGVVIGKSLRHIMVQRMHSVLVTEFFRHAMNAGAAFPSHLSTWFVCSVGRCSCS